MMDFEQACIVVIPSVEDVVASRLVAYVVHPLHVVNQGRRDDNNTRNLSAHIVQGVELHGGFPVFELRPPKQAETKADDRGVEGVNGAFHLDFQNIVCTHAPGFPNDMHGELLEDTVVTALVGSGDRGSLDTLPYAEMIAFPGMCLEHYDGVTKALPARKLSEHHQQQLVPAAEMPHAFVAVILPYDTIKYIVVKELHNLGKHIL